ncbi:hypothetical protein CspeluHIS016_0700640 [Cutaneotrichosporon spelunceum]|uniref:Uncharacterized protein n=1 Tax=Cutaneotrichosporon spelunceum TaxID=1672016 RepID=A0AAD3YEI4_9TREE|nr:hypothetical protein CspeluHIS016_0700640 [Cutaneotrichosporon spelunceum]
MRSHILLAAVAALPAVLAVPIADPAVVHPESAFSGRDADAVAAEARQIPGLPFSIPSIPGIPIPGASGTPGTPSAPGLPFPIPTIPTIPGIPIPTITGVPIPGASGTPGIPGLPFPVPGIPGIPGIPTAGTPGLPQFPFGDWAKMVAQFFGNIPGMPKGFIETLTNIITGLFGGKSPNAADLAKIQAAPTSVNKDVLNTFMTLAKNFPFFGPLFAPFLGFLQTIVSMGSSVFPGPRDIHDRQIPGLPPMGDLTKQFNEALALAGIGAEATAIVMDLMMGFASGKIPDPAKLMKLFGLGVQSLSKILGVFEQMVSKFPGAGVFFGPMISGLKMALMMAGFVGNMAGSGAGGLA